MCVSTHTSSSLTPLTPDPLTPWYARKALVKFNLEEAVSNPTLKRRRQRRLVEAWARDRLEPRVKFDQAWSKKSYASVTRPLSPSCHGGIATPS